MTEGKRMATNKDQPVVGLFVTCLADAMRPSVGMAAVKLFEAACARSWCWKTRHAVASLPGTVVM